MLFRERHTPRDAAETLLVANKNQRHEKVFGPLPKKHTLYSLQTKNRCNHSRAHTHTISHSHTQTHTHTLTRTISHSYTHSLATVAFASCDNESLPLSCRFNHACAQGRRTHFHMHATTQVV